MFRSLLCGMLIFWGFTGLQAQVSKKQRDSLYHQIEQSKSDTERFDLYLSICESFKSINADSILFYAQKANKQIEIKNNQQLGKFNQALALAYAEKRDFDSSSYYFERALQGFKEAGNVELEFQTRYLYGAFLNDADHSKKAIEEFHKALLLKEKVIDNQTLSSIYNSLGLAYHYTGDYNLALKYYLESLIIIEKQAKPIYDLADVYGNMGSTYFDLKEYDKAKDYANKALKIFKEAGDTVKYIKESYDVAITYYGKKLYKEALNYLENTLASAKLYGDFRTEINSMQVMALAYMKLKNYEEAEKLLLLAEQKFPPEGPVFSLAYIKTNLGHVYYNWGNNVVEVQTEKMLEAIKWADEGKKLSEEIDLTKLIKDCFEILYKSYTKIGEYKKAIAYAERYMTLKDSILNEQKQKAILELEEKYQTEKKDLEISLLNQEAELKEARLLNGKITRKRQKLTIYILSAITILIALLGLVIFRFYRDKLKTNQQLVERNEIISRQKDENEVLLKEIHHRVKNNMQIVSSLLDLQSRRLSDETTKEAINEGQHRVRAMALIHEMLYENENMSVINIQDYIFKLYHQIVKAHSQVEVQQDIQVDSNIRMDIDMAIPIGLILTELITNSIKYAFNKSEKGQISITLNEEGLAGYKLQVKDNGIGLPPSFEIRQAKTLGLRLVNTLTTQLQGRLNYQSKEGTVFTFSFPKAV